MPNNAKIGGHRPQGPDPKKATDVPKHKRPIPREVQSSKSTQPSAKSHKLSKLPLKAKSLLSRVAANVKKAALKITSTRGKLSQSFTNNFAKKINEDTIRYSNEHKIAMGSDASKGRTAQSEYYTTSMFKDDITRTPHLSLINEKSESTTLADMPNGIKSTETEASKILHEFCNNDANQTLALSQILTQSTLGSFLELMADPDNSPFELPDGTKFILTEPMHREMTAQKDSEGNLNINFHVEKEFTPNENLDGKDNLPTLAGIQLIDPNKSHVSFDFEVKLDSHTNLASVDPKKTKFSYRIALANEDSNA